MSDQSNERLTATEEPGSSQTEQAGLRPDERRPEPTTDARPVGETAAAATTDAGGTVEEIAEADPNNPVEADVVTPVVDREPEQWGQQEPTPEGTEGYPTP